MSTERKVKLKGWDHAQIFEVDEVVAQESEVLKDLIEAVGGEGLIALPNVSRETLAKVIEFCKYHVEAAKKSEDNPAAAEDEIKRWEKEFLKVELKTLFRLLNAANYLNIKKLLEVTVQAVTDMIQDKSPEEIRKIVRIKNDFTPQEEAEVRFDYGWAFD